MAYPLSEFDGTMKTKDWSDIPSLPWIKLSNEEWRWVDPGDFFDVLPEVLDACPPLPGEEALYALVRSVLDAAQRRPRLAQGAERGRGRSRRGAGGAAARVPQFRHPAPPPLDHGDQQRGVRHRLLHAHRRGEVEHLHQPAARDALFLPGPRPDGARLNGAKRYTVTFKELPPVKGFWSITLYDQYHFFAPNEINRFSLGTKSQGLRFEADGSLTIYVQNERPDADKVSNWLPAPDERFSLYIRAYWPLPPIQEGRWTPPPVCSAS